MLQCCGMPRWPRFLVYRRRRTARVPTVAYRTHKETARALLTERVLFYAPLVGVAPGRIAIRDTRRSWGSCSSKGNLNFNYKLLFLPACWRDYIVVHELCHLHHLNHSAAFWAEVARIMPDYRERATALRVFERTQGTSVQILSRAFVSHACARCVVTLEYDRTAVFVPPEGE